MRRLATFLDISGVETTEVNEKALESRHRTKKSGSGSKLNRPQSVLTSTTALALERFFLPFNEELWGILGRKLEW